MKIIANRRVSTTTQDCQKFRAKGAANASIALLSEVSRTTAIYVIRTQQFGEVR